MKCACVVLNYNDWEHTVTFTDQVSRYVSLSKIIVVDNCSTDESYKHLQQLQSDKIVVMRADKNAGYGAGNNLGARVAFEKMKMDAVLICNPDVVFEEKVVEKLIAVAKEHSDCGVVSAVQHDRNDAEIGQSAWRIPTKIQYIFSIEKIFSHVLPSFYNTREELHLNPITQVDCVAGSLLLITKAAFLETGGYDERVFLYCEETILGCKVKAAGFNTYICSDVHYLHLHGVTISKNVSNSVERKRMLIKSHQHTLKEYLHAGTIMLALDTVICKIAIAEEYLRNILLNP